MNDREEFEKRVVPVMDRVRNDLRSKQAAEVSRFMRSPAYIFSGGIGPDGGMATQAMALDTLNVTGEWNSKTVEDYVEMVKAELRKEHIEVTPQMEEMMIDKMARDQMPKSAIDYILRKAAGNTIFGLPEEMRKTPLQREIEDRGEKMYGPSPVEKGVGWGLGAAADFATLGGLSGGLAGGLKFVGVDLAMNAVIDTVDSKKKDVPLVVLPGHEEEWLEMSRKEQEKQKAPIPEHEAEPVMVKEEKEDIEVQEREDGDNRETEQKKVQEQENVQEQNQETREQPVKDNTGGWQGILSTLGLNGLGDIGRNAGYILAMLPDMLLGMFTGKTKSLGLKDNLIPVASIMAGLFVKNPLLKMTLIGLGGANLINKAGHEQLSKQEGEIRDNPDAVRYLQYDEQEMNPRIRDTQIKGNTLFASIDGIPVTIALPEKVVDAYNRGALPMGALANAVLDRCDQMQQLPNARDLFEEESRETGRTLSQR